VPAPAASGGGAASNARRKSKPVIALAVPPPSVATPAEPAGEPRRAIWARWLNSPPVASFLASLVFHVALLLLLAMVFQVRLPGTGSEQLLASIAAPDVIETLAPLGDSQAAESTTLVPGTAQAAAQAVTPIQVLDPSVNEESSTMRISPRDTAPPSPGASAELLYATDTDLSGAMDGRKGNARGEAALSGGGTQQSENAVERGLRWIMVHQARNGSWRYDLRGGTCQGLCRNPGSEQSTTAATAMALLPYLGAGYTHQEGEYQEVVRRGLYYLQSRAKKAPRGTDWREGEQAALYSQGLVAIAFCEAYAMTKDMELKQPAQQAIDFIVYAQDKRGGGWRYGLGEPGDTTVTGWQVMALKSAQMAGLVVPSPTIALAKKFLDGVQCESGARYGYQTPEPRRSTTAIGLLLRMYTGWGRERPALYRGIQYLVDWGPSKDNLYYDFYAAQVLHHWGGSEWGAWNQKLREHLIRTQGTTGHEAGSWHFDDVHGNHGGRLYSTAMAVLTLEVYYRFLPLYGRHSLRGDW
jgi:hypothetical protein